MNRWLTPDDAAEYLGIRPRELPQLVKAGRLPQPSRHLGPRRPRYDREELDRIMGTAARSGATRETVNDAVQQIFADWRARQQKAPRGRVNQGIPLHQAPAVVALRRG